MNRRIWIIKDRQVKAADLSTARKNDCPEVVCGIPPALQGIITEDMLPCMYEEPEPAKIEPVKSLEEEIADLKAAIDSMRDEMTKLQTRTKKS